jgi:hypothetical protein
MRELGVCSIQPEGTSRVKGPKSFWRSDAGADEPADGGVAGAFPALETLSLAQPDKNRKSPIPEQQAL